MSARTTTNRPHSLDAAVSTVVRGVFSVFTAVSPEPWLRAVMAGDVGGPDHAVPAGPLGQVDGGVGVVQQLLRLGARTGRDADADGEPEFLRTVQPDRFGADDVAQRLTEPGGRAEIQAGDDAEELLATPPAEASARGHRALQALGDDPQYDVAGGVTLAVVDLLEVVDVDDGDGDGVLLAAGRLRDRRERLVERTAVRQPGERVGAAQPGQCLDLTAKGTLPGVQLDRDPDARRAGPGVERLQGAEAVQLGHVDIEQDRVRRVHLDEGERPPPVRCLDDAEPGFLQCAPDEGTDRARVVHDQDDLPAHRPTRTGTSTASRTRTTTICSPTRNEATAADAVPGTVTA